MRALLGSRGWRRFGGRAASKPYPQITKIICVICGWIYPKCRNQKRLITRPAKNECEMRVRNRIGRLPPSRASSQNSVPRSLRNCFSLSFSPSSQRSLQNNVVQGGSTARFGAARRTRKIFGRRSFRFCAAMRAVNPTPKIRKTNVIHRRIFS